MTLTLNEYQQQAARTRQDATNRRDAMANAALGIAGEAGEIADIVKKGLYHHHYVDSEKMLKELGDELWYLAWMADLWGYTLEDVARANIEKLWQRYPEGFDTQRSINRNDECVTPVTEVA